MKPVKNEKIVHQQKQTTNLNASRAAQNFFAGRMFVTSVPLRRFQTAFLSTVSCCSNRRQSTLRKTNDTSSSGVPRVSRVFGQIQFRRSQPIRGQSFLAFFAEN